MIIIEKVFIENFRGFHNTEISFGRPVNAIIGRNGTMKTTLLGILAHPFSLETGAMSSEEPLIGGKKFNSKMGDKFKFSDTFDIPGTHKWTLTINPEVYPKGSFTCVSEKRKDNNRIRFWSTEGREKGMNYIQCPVIYLSMKRLLPIGEENNIKVVQSSLTEEEIQLYTQLHNRILINSDPISAVSRIESQNKVTLGPSTEYSDALTISAGQDNVGRIILSILSMKRLKDKYEHDYKGGLIFIDELESTLYPAAQEKLIEYMFESAWKYKIQYFFTTHSMSIINYLKTGEHQKRPRIVYLQRFSGKIIAHEDPPLKEIENDLNVAAGRKGSSSKIKVYCEDSVGITMAKALLPGSIKQKIEFVSGMDLSWTTYKTLYQHKVPEFLNSILLLDGDVRSNNNWSAYPKNRNITLLPSEMAPERMIYEELYSLDQEDEFWDNSIGGYQKSVCFRDCPNHLSEIDDIKVWFNKQKCYAGRSYSKFIGQWKKNHEKEIALFINDFIRAYNYVAYRVGNNLIDCEK